MGMKLTFTITESISELKDSRLRALNKWHLKRLDCLILLKLDSTRRLDDIAKEVGV